MLPNLYFFLLKHVIFPEKDKKGSTTSSDIQCFVFRREALEKPVNKQLKRFNENFRNSVEKELVCICFCLVLFYNLGFKISTW